VMPFVEKTATGRDDFTGRSTQRTGALVARSPACRELVMDQHILAAANGFLSPYTERILLHLTQTIRILPGQGAQTIHRDRLAWGIRGHGQCVRCFSDAHSCAFPAHVCLFGHVSRFNFNDVDHATYSSSNHRWSWDRPDILRDASHNGYRDRIDYTSVGIKRLYRPVRGGSNAGG